MIARWLVMSFALVAIVACHPTPRARRATTGGIMGLVRDRQSGAAIALAELDLRRDGALDRTAATKSSDRGVYSFEGLPPGRYALAAYYAGDSVEVDHIVVVAGQVAPVDLAFELGRGEPVVVDFGDPADGAIDHYTPRDGDPATGRIEGTVSDSATRQRVPGAVVTAVVAGPAAAAQEARQVVTDDQGRFVFDGLSPGAYSISAYYSIQRRGQIEVQRNNLAVAGGQAVVVPLWIELEGQ